MTTTTLAGNVYGLPEYDLLLFRLSTPAYDPPLLLISLRLPDCPPRAVRTVHCRTRRPTLSTAEAMSLGGAKKGRPDARTRQLLPTMDDEHNRETWVTGHGQFRPAVERASWPGSCRVPWSYFVMRCGSPYLSIMSNQYLPSHRCVKPWERMGRLLPVTGWVVLFAYIVSTDRRVSTTVPSTRPSLLFRNQTRCCKPFNEQDAKLPKTTTCVSSAAP